MKLLIWLFSLSDRQVPISDPAEKLLYGMTVTSKCRYNASIRIKRLSRFSFFTTTILSLGLILIPLLQNSDIQLAYPSRVLNMLQIFLAVAVLVYSVVNSTSQFETRSERLNECGDKIKEMIRSLRAEVSKAKAVTPTASIELSSYHQRYTDVSTDSENHTRADYSLAVIRTPEYYNITGVPWLWEWTKATCSTLTPYLLPAALMTLEAVFILDMLGITSVLTEAFKPVTR
jgi:hypothetical protein